MMMRMTGKDIEIGGDGAEKRGCMCCWGPGKRVVKTGDEDDEGGCGGSRWGGGL